MNIHITLMTIDEYKNLVYGTLRTSLRTSLYQGDTLIIPAVCGRTVTVSLRNFGSGKDDVMFKDIWEKVGLDHITCDGCILSHFAEESK